MENGIKVEDNPVIPYIEGDGIGKDVTNSAIQILNKAVSIVYNNQRKIVWKEVYAGEKAKEKSGEYLPKETIKAFREYCVGIKGPLTTPVGKGFRSLNVALRQELDLFTCLRPVKWFSGVPSPIKHPEDVNLHIFRENTEDIYAGIEFLHKSPDNEKLKKFLIDEMNVKNIRFPDTSSLGIKPVSEQGSKRLIQAAIEYAIQHKLPSVTLVHKGNIMKYTEGMFCKWGYELAAKQYKNIVITMDEVKKIQKDNTINAQHILKNKIIIKDCIADAFLQNMLLYPQDYSVIATLNLNGDYISDLAAAMVGGIGIAPGANINYNTGIAIFEATHGTAPDIAGKNKANPCSLLLSGAMMLDYLGWSEAAEIIRQAIESVINKKKVTSDLFSMIKDAELVSTDQFTNEIIAFIEKIK